MPRRSCAARLYAGPDPALAPPPTINLDNPAVVPKLNLAPHKAVRRRIDVALSNSFGFGGTNASLILGRVPVSEKDFG